MKKFYFCLLALIFAASSCSNDIDGVSPAVDGSAPTIIEVIGRNLKIEKVGDPSGPIDIGIIIIKENNDDILSFDPFLGLYRFQYVLDKLDELGIKYELSSYGIVSIKKTDDYKFIITKIPPQAP
ncbi:hypothetical protein Barb7_02454 [Bacteroidales bacterium Barb7]|nr:hypothetical protein Barb7_02454 [Bacteroidales bacterium Barb7]